MKNTLPEYEATSLPDILSSKKKLQCSVLFEGTPISIDFTPSLVQSKNLIFKFHGAVNRKDPSRKLPVFVPSHPQLADDWNQISISDPTLLRYDDLTIGWYIGCKSINLQDILARFFYKITNIMNINKTVYFGNSSGGFAALFYSACDPGSVAVVLNPQSSLVKFYQRLVLSYLDICWQAKSLNALAGSRVHDISSFYKNSRNNAVVYIQNLADLHHLHRHFEPFLRSVGARVEATNRGVSDLISDVSFWGRQGHSAIPPEGYLPWLEAIAAAENTSGDAILKARAEHIAQERKARSAPAAPAQTSGGFAENDLALADAIAKWNAR